jgi:hypothetical protein
MYVFDTDPKACQAYAAMEKVNDVDHRIHIGVLQPMSIVGHDLIKTHDFIDIDFSSNTRHGDRSEETAIDLRPRAIAPRRIQD